MQKIPFFIVFLDPLMTHDVFLTTTYNGYINETQRKEWLDSNPANLEMCVCRIMRLSGLLEGELLRVSYLSNLSYKIHQDTSKYNISTGSHI